ncbi:hypothetical protein CR513_43251, partial [Mucuna pruriens]
MLKKNLPKEYWAKTAHTAIFLLNELPTKYLVACILFMFHRQNEISWTKRQKGKIFVGYNSISKAYRIFQPNTKIFLIIEFPDQVSKSQLNENELADDIPIKGMRSLYDIYQRCNVAVLEPTDLWEAKKIRIRNRLQQPTNRKVIAVKWVFRTKLNPDGLINKHKVKLVVKGYAQIFYVDFSDTFAPVARLDTIKLLLAIAAQKGWKVYQLDVEQPEGFAVKGQEDDVYLLKKALYGLKQAPRAWYKNIDEYLMKLGFKRILNEAILYIKGDGTNFVVVSLYVDDLLVTESNEELVRKFKENMKQIFYMKQIFDMTDLGEMAYFLGIEINQKN